MSHGWIPDDLRFSGRSLSDSLGVDEFAWDRDTALELVGRLAAAGTSILGGDVYVEDDERLRPAYASWHCERRPDERLTTFVERSCAEARRFLESYAEPPRRRTLYVLVVSGEETAGM